MAVVYYPTGDNVEIIYPNPKMRNILFFNDVGPIVIDLLDNTIRGDNRLRGKTAEWMKNVEERLASLKEKYGVAKILYDIIHDQPLYNMTTNRVISGYWSLLSVPVDCDYVYFSYTGENVFSERCLGKLYNSTEKMAQVLSFSSFTARFAVPDGNTTMYGRQLLYKLMAAQLAYKNQVVPSDTKLSEYFVGSLSRRSIQEELINMSNLGDKYKAQSDDYIDEFVMAPSVIAAGEYKVLEDKRPFLVRPSKSWKKALSGLNIKTIIIDPAKPNCIIYLENSYSTEFLQQKSADLEKMIGIPCFVFCEESNQNETH